MRPGQHESQALQLILVSLYYSPGMISDDESEEKTRLQQLTDPFAGEWTAIRLPCTSLNMKIRVHRMEYGYRYSTHH